MPPPDTDMNVDSVFLVQIGNLSFGSDDEIEQALVDREGELSLVFMGEGIASCRILTRHGRRRNPLTQSFRRFCKSFATNPAS